MFINNTDSENEFSKPGKINNVSCFVLFTRPAPHKFARTHIRGGGNLLTGRGAKEWEEQDFVDNSFSAAVYEDRASCDNTRSATILLHASR